MAEQMLVFVDAALAGVAEAELSESGRRALFRYDPAHLAAGDRTPLSLSFPAQPGVHDITAWLDGLLPDDVDTRRRWQREQAAAGADPMSLLASPVGLDCAGAVQFCAPGGEHLLQQRPHGIEWAHRSRDRRLGQRCPPPLGGTSLRASAHARRQLTVQPRRLPAQNGSAL